jgi:DNA mismatch endonuclease Vsr
MELVAPQRLTQAPSFRGLKPSSRLASRVGQGNVRENTKPELVLSRALRRLGLLFTMHDPVLPGRPDFVFSKQRVTVFCDGDFWHGRKWAPRRRKLARGHNAEYWVQKIEGNIERDRQARLALSRLGWRVCRVWGSDVLVGPERAARRVAAFLSLGALRGRRSSRR